MSDTQALFTGICLIFSATTIIFFVIAGTDSHRDD